MNGFPESAGLMESGFFFCCKQLGCLSACRGVDSADKVCGVDTIVCGVDSSLSLFTPVGGVEIQLPVQMLELRCVEQLTYNTVFTSVLIFCLDVKLL